MKKLLSLALILALTLGLVPGVLAAEEVPTIKWVQVGNGMPKNYDAWKANLDPYLEEKIGAHIEMEIVSWGDWNQRRNVIVNTNEDYDILFTNLETFSNDVNIGAFADITELLDGVPALKELLPETYWKSVTIGDKIYGVPTMKDNAIAIYFIWDQAVADKYEIDIDAIKDFADLDEPLRKMKAEEGSPLFLTSNGLHHITAWYDKLGTGLPLGVHYKDDSKKVVPIFEQEDIMERLKLMHTWFNEGIINADAAIQPENPTYRMFFIEQGWSLAAKSTWGPNMGLNDQGKPIYNIEARQWGESTMSNDSIQGSISCISKSSKHPDKALALLELVNTDAKVRDALYYGLECEDFKYTSDGKLHRISTDWPMAGYTQGSFFAATQLDTDEFNQWEEVKELNANAIPSPALGFQFEYAEVVGDEVINCKEIWERYKSELLTGTVNPEEAVPQMMEELRSAGFDKIIEEAQKQLDAFK